MTHFSRFNISLYVLVKGTKSRIREIHIYSLSLNYLFLYNNKRQVFVNLFCAKFAKLIRRPFILHVFIFIFGSFGNEKTICLYSLRKLSYTSLLRHIHKNTHTHTMHFLICSKDFIRRNTHYAIVALNRRFNCASFKGALLLRSLMKATPRLIAIPHRSFPSTTQRCSGTQCL